MKVYGVYDENAASKNNELTMVKELGKVFDKAATEEQEELTKKKLIASLMTVLPKKMMS